MKKIFNPEYKNNRKKYFSDISDDKWNDWQWQIDNRITEANQLKNFFQNIDVEAINKVSERFSFSVTPYFLSLINNAPLFINSSLYNKSRKYNEKY